MNRERVARELVSIASELTAAYIDTGYPDIDKKMKDFKRPLKSWDDLVDDFKTYMDYAQKCAHDKDFRSLWIGLMNAQENVEEIKKLSADFDRAIEDLMKTLDHGALEDLRHSYRRPAR